MKLPRATEVNPEAAGRPRRPALALTLQCGDGIDGAPFAHAQIRRWVLAALTAPATLTLRFIEREESRRLNCEYRGQDHATNVLTFGYSVDPTIADVLICVPVVVDEAAAQGKTFKDHLAHLVVHGVLHAQGWDHINDAQAHAMESLETQILARFRIQNPYQNQI